MARGKINNLKQFWNIAKLHFVSFESFGILKKEQKKNADY